MIEWTILILTSASTTLLNLLPYVLAGVLVSEILKYVTWANVLAKIAIAAPMRTIAMSVGLGIISPMCTYGTIPIVLTLIAAGFPVAALASFLIASSLMNPQLFVITWGGISPAMALSRFVAAALFAFLSGLILLRVNSHWFVNPALTIDQPPPTKAKSFVWKEFLYNALHSLQFVGFYIVLGVLLGAVVEILVPTNWLVDVFQEPEWLGILFGALAGIPLYACGGGTIPLIDALLDKGLSPGAALAFFIVGPATRITPLIALATIMRPRFIIVLILLLFLYAIGAGLMIIEFI